MTDGKINQPVKTKFSVVKLLLCVYGSRSKSVCVCVRGGGGWGQVKMGNYRRKHYNLAQFPPKIQTGLAQIWRACVKVSEKVRQPDKQKTSRQTDEETES